jgi:hypothetical protein
MKIYRNKNVEIELNEENDLNIKALNTTFKSEKNIDIVYFLSQIIRSENRFMYYFKDSELEKIHNSFSYVFIENMDYQQFIVKNNLVYFYICSDKEERFKYYGKEEFGGFDISFFINCLKIKNNKIYGMVSSNREEVIKKLEKIKTKNNVQNF